MSTATRFFVEYPVVIGTALAVFFAAARWIAVPGDRKRSEWFLLASALAMPAAMSCELLAGLLSRLVPLKLDQYIFRIDGFLGQPSFLIGRFVVRHFWLEVISNVAYGALPCAILVVFGAYLWMRPESETLTVLRTFILNLFLAVPLYLLVPVCGPAFAFPGFPFSVPMHLVPHPILLTYAPNGIPSVHMSTALLLVWFAWRWRAARPVSLAYLLLVVVATLGSGQHYLFDLACAIPYSAAVLSLGRREWPVLKPHEVAGAVV